MSSTPATVERMKTKYRIPFGTTKLDELFALGLDAVFVHSPTSTHYDIAMKCMAQGVAVYVDKPFSYEWAESVEMASYAERKGVLLAAGFNRALRLYISRRSNGCRKRAVLIGFSC